MEQSKIIDTTETYQPPPSFSSLFPFLLSYSYYMEGGGGILLPVGVGLLQGAP